jgi:hypothetical protein
MRRWTTPCARGWSQPSGTYEPVTRIERLLPVLSLPASSLNESSGARTPLTSLVTGGLVERGPTC